MEVRLGNRHLIACTKNCMPQGRSEHESANGYESFIYSVAELGRSADVPDFSVQLPFLELCYAAKLCSHSHSFIFRENYKCQKVNRAMMKRNMKQEG